ncbi:hypothetical protein BSLG_010789 [Batrachochytrium salamandrivorans]|nr:hypothetical protein BSLG_010789 [Batrachochytrium salamandrivorans]
MFGPALTLVLALASSAVIAAPTVDNVYKRAVASLNPSSTEFPFHFPESDGVKTATDFISKKLNLGANDFKVVDSYTDAAGVTHVYGAHILNGARICNHQASAHVKNGQVTSFSSSFGTEQHLAKRDLAVSEPKATLDFAKASATASAQLGIPVYSDFEYALEYVEQPDGKVVYAYKLQLRNDPVTKWVEVWCDANTGKVIQAVNFANKASYKAISFPRRDAYEGFSMVSNPEFRGASPNGWTDGKFAGGNNVITLAPNGKAIPSTRDGVFDTKFNSREDPGTDDNIVAAACWQLQTNNSGNGGRGNDAIVINVLNPSDTNNADFLSPPDGRPGVMNMYRFTYTTPNRSSGFDNSVIIHEYAHGISNRLTGGPSTGGCLSTAEARGMGEGWSDVIALIVLAKSSDTATTKVTIGTYSRNRAVGFRSYPYTTDMRVNPLTYGDLRTLREVHDVGEVWASMLWDVYWSLVAKHRFSSNLYDASQSAGNVVAMNIIMGGMTLQPCNPTFLSARNAIIAADASYYDGANRCEIIRAFAKRGLGAEATGSRTNDFSLPSECQ